VYGVCVAEKGVFRFTLTTEGRAGHASIPRIGDNALTKMGPVLDALRARHARYFLTPEPEALLRAMGEQPSEDRLEELLRQVEQTDPRVAILLEPMLGVSLTPTMIHASDKINVIPAHARLQVDCRVPPGLGEDAARNAVQEVVGTDGYRLDFDERVIGNRSRIDTPLMDRVRDFISREDPGAEAAPVVLPGFSDSRWFREAFPDCVAYGFFPQRAMDLFEATPLIHSADERVPVEDLGLAARFYAELAPQMLG
jgi:acetylornithine deacetylase/succinyl-diaminopimelate desuccinylase-like protein